jgi:hypothetical protein
MLARQIFEICAYLNYDVTTLDVANICAIFDLLCKIHGKRVISTEQDMEKSLELDARIIFGGEYDHWTPEYKSKVHQDIACTYM